MTPAVVGQLAVGMRADPLACRQQVVPLGWGSPTVVAEPVVAAELGAVAALGSLPIVVAVAVQDILGSLAGSEQRGNLDNRPEDTVAVVEDRQMGLLDLGFLQGRLARGMVAAPRWHR